MDKLRRTRSLSAGADRHPLDRADRLVRQPAARHRREGPSHARRHRRRHRPRGDRDLRAARRGAGRHRRGQAPAAGDSGDGASCIRSNREAKRLGLPGRTSLEPVSGEIGSRADVPHRRDPGRRSRATSRAGRIAIAASRNASTCCKGTGVTVAESGEIPMTPGDIVLIPPNEKHMTRNTGTEPLVLLCFFPEPDVTRRAPTSSPASSASVPWPTPCSACGRGRLRARRRAAAGRRSTVTYHTPDDPARAAAHDARRARAGDSRGRAEARAVPVRESTARARAGDRRRARPARSAGADAAAASRSPTCPAAATTRSPNTR